MPKRKRMSFTVKKRHSTSTPNRTPQSTKRARGRPPKSAFTARPRTPSPNEHEDGDESGGDEEEEELNQEGENSELHTQKVSEVDSNDDNGSSNADDTGDDDNDEEDEEDAPQAEPSLTIAYVPKSTIEKKWTHLDAASQAAVSRLIDASSRPVVAAHLDQGRAERDDGRGVEAQDAVARAVRALKKRLPRMPFPPLPTSSNSNSNNIDVNDDDDNNDNNDKNTSGSSLFDPEPLRRRNRTLRTEAAAYSRDLVPALEQELAAVNAAVEERGAAADGFEAEYERERDMVRENRAGSRFADLLRIPGVGDDEDGDGDNNNARPEPDDSADRIRLAPWEPDKRRRKTKEKEARALNAMDLPAEARRLVERLRTHVAGLQVDGNDGRAVLAAQTPTTEQLEADLERASVVTDRLLMLQHHSKRKIGTEQLSVG